MNWRLWIPLFAFAAFLGLAAYQLTQPKDEFVRTRSERDATLSLPDRMLHALQVNLRAGKLPHDEADGNIYLKIPVNRL